MARNFQTNLILGGDPRGGLQALRQVRGEMDRTRGNTRNLSKSFRGFNSQTMGLNSSLMRLSGILGVSLSFGAAIRGVQQLASDADGIGKLAERTNFSVERLQEYRFAAEQSGASSQQFDESISRLNRRLGLFAETGGGPAASAIERLGINIRNTDGQLRATDELFLEITQRISEMTSAQQQAAVASEFFGDEAGPKLVNLLSQGSDGIEELARQAQATGSILSTEAVDAAQRYADSMNRIRLQMRGVTVQVFEGLIPSLEATVEQFVRTSNASSPLQEAGRAMGTALNVAARAAVVVTTTFQAAVQAVVSLEKVLQGAVAQIIAPLEGLVRTLQVATTALLEGDFAAAAASFKEIGNNIAGASAEAKALTEEGLAGLREIPGIFSAGIDSVMDLYNALQEAGAEGENTRDILGEFGDQDGPAGALDAAAKKAADFMDKIDGLAATLQGPVAVAIRQYNIDLERATLLHQQGALTADEFGRAQEVLARQLQSRVLPVMQDLMEQMLDIATFNFGGQSGAGGSGSAAADLARGLSLAISGSQGASLGESIGTAIKTFGTAGIQEGLQDALTDAFEGMDLDDAEMQVAFLAIGEAIGGNIGAAVGTAVGASIGAALSGGSPIGMQIGAMIGNAVGGLFDRQKDPILQTAGRFGFSRDPEEARRRGDITETALGEVFFRFRNVGEEAAGTLKRALRQFDGTLADILGEEFLDDASALLENFRTDSQDMGTILQRRFDLIITTVDDFAQAMASSGDTLEQQVQNLVDVFRLRNLVAIGDDMGAEDGDMVIWLAQQLARAGETIAESFGRLLTVTTALDTAVGLTGNQISQHRDQVIRFGDALSKAFGDDLQRLTRGLNTIFEAFFTDEERFEQQAEAARTSATELLSDLGLEVTEEMLTAEGFRAVFDNLFGTLTPEMTAILIEAGVAVSDLIDAEEGLAGLRTEEVESVEDLTAILNERAGLERRLLQVQGDTAALRELELAAIDESNRAILLRIHALEDEAALTDIMVGVNRDLLSIISPTRAAYAQLMDALIETAARAHELGASEEQLMQIRQLAERQISQFTNDLKISILTLADDLLGTEDTFQDVGNAIVNATVNIRDAVIRNLERIDEWLDRSLLGNFSPLTPTERLGEAQSQFDSAFRSAMSGDFSALESLPALADALLGEGAGFFGTSTAQFRELFDSVRDMMEQASEITPPAAMQPPTFGQVEEIKTETSAFRRRLDELEQMQKAWSLGEQIGALAGVTGGIPSALVRDLGFTDRDMRRVLGLIGEDAGIKTGEELDEYFDSIIGGIKDPGGTNDLLRGVRDLITTLNRIFGTFVDEVKKWPDQGIEPPVEPPEQSFATGGPVPYTGNALVHSGEYVVPRNGTLVSADPEHKAIAARQDGRLRNIERILAQGFGGVIDEERRTRQTMSQRRETARV